MFISNLICFIICIIAIEFSSFSSSIATQLPINSGNPILRSNLVSSKLVIDSFGEADKSNNWVLELRNNIWWWVLYDVDGTKIMEVPAEL